MENIKVDKLKIYQKIKGGLDRTNRKNRMLSRLGWYLAVFEFAALLLIGFHWRSLNVSYNLLCAETKGRAINIVFVENATENNIRKVLLRTGVKIVDGPTPEGLYKVKPYNPQNLENVLKILKNSRIVRFVEVSY